MSVDTVRLMGIMTNIIIVIYVSNLDFTYAPTALTTGGYTFSFSEILQPIWGYCILIACIGIGSASWASHIETALQRDNPYTINAIGFIFKLCAGINAFVSLLIGMIGLAIVVAGL